MTHHVCTLTLAYSSMTPIQNALFGAIARAVFDALEAGDRGSPEPTAGYLASRVVLDVYRTHVVASIRGCGDFDLHLNDDGTVEAETIG